MQITWKSEKISVRTSINRSSVNVPLITQKYYTLVLNKIKLGRFVSANNCYSSSPKLINLNISLLPYLLNLNEYLLTFRPTLFCD